MRRRRRLDTLDTLAQYVLVTRLAAVTLTMAVLARHVVPDPWLAFVFCVLIGFNYIALRRWPDAVRVLHIAEKPYYLALDCCLSAVVLAIVGVGAPLVLYLVGTGLLAGLVYSRRATALAQLAALGTFETAHRARLGYLPGGDDVHMLVTLPALLVVAGFAGATVRRLIKANEEATEEIGALQAQAAVREERLRVARDLHDSVTKNLHGVWLLARAFDGAVNRGDLATARACAATVASTASDLASQARGVISGLREDGAAQPLERALEDVVTRVVAGHGLTMTVRATATAAPTLDPRIRQAVLAVAAEAVHNTVKHADARHLTIGLDVLGEWLRVVVDDDGRGFDGAARSGHFGLAGMRERAERAGGRLTIQLRPGGGTRVELRVPMVIPAPSTATHRARGVHEPAAG